ncbi:MAG: hypothetical protein ACR5LF_00720 [Symbiopectobacterium sp.]
MKIGIIGAGFVGRTIATLAINTGHFQKQNTLFANCIRSVLSVKI